jgi:hypothetical protein
MPQPPSYYSNRLTSISTDAEYQALKSEIDADILLINSSINGKITTQRNNAIAIGNAKDSINANTDINRTAYKLYNDTRDEYDSKRMANGLLFVITLFLLSIVDLFSTYVLLFVMSLSALYSSIDMGFAIRTFILLLFGFGIYDIRRRFMIKK